jgi:hypothetical protein
MKTKAKGPLPLCIGPFAVLILAMASGCGSPSRANVQLRKANQELEAHIAALTQEREADQARIAALEKHVGTTPVLSEGTLEAVFTTRKMELGRLTGPADFDLNKPGDDGIKVYLMPIDETGEAIKATGKVTVELFDLGLSGDNRLGRWEFAPGQIKDRWRSLGPLHAFVLECPWQKMPSHSNLTLHVVFDDALTGREFVVDREVELSKVPTTRPSQ